jgi:ATP/maltotriose-dependent transcriptional regulator MalT
MEPTINSLRAEFTVKGHAKSLYRKLDATSRQEAVDRARELDLI